MWKDSETEIDYLDFSYIVEIMKDTINNMATQETLILVKTGYTVPMVAGATMVFIITILIVNKKKFILTKDKNYGNEVKVKKKLFRKMYK